jgi:hypothetical protein
MRFTITHLDADTLTVTEKGGDTMRYVREASKGPIDLGTAAPERSRAEQIGQLLEQLMDANQVTAVLAQVQLVAIGKPAVPALQALCPKLDVLQRRLRHRDAALAATVTHPDWEFRYQGRPVGLSRDLEMVTRAKLLCADTLRGIEKGER